MRTYSRTAGKPFVSLGVSMVLLLLSACESPLLEQIREATQAAGETVYYTVTYDRNGATSGDVPIDDSQYQQGDTVTVMGNVRGLEIVGKTWIGWNTRVDGGEETFHSEGAQFPMGSASVRLYAQWTDKPTYVVSYLANEATSGNPPANQTKTHDVPLTLQTNSGSPPLSRTGYTLDGWNTQEDGNGTDYALGSSYTTNVELTLFAKWKANEYPVSYSANGGNGNPPANQIKTHDVTLTLQTNSGSPTLSRTGYTLVGWNDQENGDGTDYALGSNYTTNAALTLFAKWIADEYPVNYLANNATSGDPPANQTKTHGVTLFLRSNTGPTPLQRTGYTFEGWNTEADGDGITYPEGAVYETNASLNLHAKWQGITYDVTLNQQSGHGGDTLVRPVYGSPMPQATAPTRVGRTFRGYYYWPNGTGTRYYTESMESARNWNRTDTDTLYAHWTPNVYRVNFNKLDGSGGDDYVDVVYGSPMPPASPPTKPGYRFAGYFTGINGSGTQYYTGTMESVRNYEQGSNTWLLAHWVDYTVGTTGPAGGTVFYDKGSYGTGADNWRYMEAAPASLEAYLPWGGQNTYIYFTKPEIGEGRPNTIVIRMTLGAGNYAANYCQSLTHNGFSDWWLPSHAELTELYRERVAVGGFQNAWYWSSYDAEYLDRARVRHFGTGELNYGMKGNNYRVRPIRYF